MKVGDTVRYEEKKGLFKIESIEPDGQVWAHNKTWDISANVSMFTLVRVGRTPKLCPMCGQSTLRTKKVVDKLNY